MPQHAPKKAATIKSKHRPSTGSPVPIVSKAKSTSNETTDCLDEPSTAIQPVGIGECKSLVVSNIGAVRSPAPNDTMQLSLKDSKRSKDLLPSYPIADTIALLLILVNFPVFLVTVTHLLFSYKEHVGSSPSLQSSANLPLFMVLSIDAVVMLFTAVVLPSLRHTITDISHVIVAVSLSGAKWRSTFGFGLGLSAIRTGISNFSSASSQRMWKINEHSWLGMLSYKLGIHTPRPFHLVSKLESDILSSSFVIDYIQSAVAMHVFTLGLVRLLNHWIVSAGTPNIRKDSESGHTHTSGSRKKRTQVVENKRGPQTCSIWDHFLRWRAETTEKRQEVIQIGDHNNAIDVWLDRVLPTYITFGLRSREITAPDLSMHVNGLIWEMKMFMSTDVLPDSDSDHQHWFFYADNLSPKTEYDIDLRVSDALGTTHLYHFSVCTSPRGAKSYRKRGDHHAPTISTHVDDVPVTIDTSSGHLSGPLSPVSTLGESIATASAKLDERKLLMKKTRKDNAKKLHTLQKEVDHLGLRAGGSGDKHEQRMQGRMLSLQTEIKRIQDSIDDMENEKLEIVALRDRQMPTWTAEKQRRDHEAELLEIVRMKYDSEKVEHQRRFAAVEAESSKIRAKADKLSLRRTKIQQDLDRLSVEQDELLNREYLSRVYSRDAVRDQRLQAEADWLKAIHETQQRLELLELYGQ